MPTLDTLIDYKQLVEALADAVIVADPSGAGAVRASQVPTAGVARSLQRIADNSAKWWELIYVCPGLYRRNLVRNHFGSHPEGLTATTVFQALFCSYSWIYNKLTLHAAVMNATVHRTCELVGPRSFRNEFNLCLFTLLELPTVVLLWRVKLETWVDRRISAIGNDRDFEAVIPINRRDSELDSHSRFDMDGRRREFIPFRGHPDDSHILVLQMRDSFRPLS